MKVGDIQVVNLEPTDLTDNIILLDDELAMANHEGAGFERRAELIEAAFKRVQNVQPTEMIRRATFGAAMTPTEGAVESMVREALLGIIEGIDPFQAGPDGDVCIWCSRDRDRKIDSWQSSQNPDYHDEDCELIKALAVLAVAKVEERAK